MTTLTAAGMDWLDLLAQLAAIFTALVAGGGYGLYRLERLQKRRRLEAHLKAASENAPAFEGDTGKRSVLNLTARLGLTEAEILQASFASKTIARRIAADDKTGRAAALLLEYEPPE